MGIYFKSLLQTWLFFGKNPAFIFWKLSKSSTVLPLIVFWISKPFRIYKNKCAGVCMLRWYLCYLMKKLHVNNWIKPKFMAVCFKRISGKESGRYPVGHARNSFEPWFAPGRRSPCVLCFKRPLGPFGSLFLYDRLDNGLGLCLKCVWNRRPWILVLFSYLHVISSSDSTNTTVAYIPLCVYFCIS